MNTTTPRLTPETLVAHRGLQQHWPENSVVGVDAALEAGAHYLEIDIQLSSDGVALLYHDSKMERISGELGVIYEQPAAALQQLPAHEPGRLGDRFAGLTITPLADLVPVLAQYPEATCFVEMKPHSIDALGVAASWEALRSALTPVLSQCIFISFHRAFLEAAAGLPRGLILSDGAELDNPGIECDVLFADRKLLPPSGSLSPAAPLVVYEVIDPDEARDWLQRGAWLVETHHLTELLVAG